MNFNCIARFIHVFYPANANNHIKKHSEYKLNKGKGNLTAWLGNLGVVFFLIMSHHVTSSNRLPMYYHIRFHCNLLYYETSLVHFRYQSPSENCLDQRLCREDDANG